MDKMGHNLLSVGLWLTCFACGCSDRGGKPVHFIIPDSYRGLFVITENPNASAIPVIDGRYCITVPSDGRVKVKSMRPLRVWHSETAAFASGEHLPKDNIHLIAVTTYADGSTYYLIGTRMEGEYAQHVSQKEIPLGRPITIEDVPEESRDKFKSDNGAEQ
jgi:hypothetical protein